MPESGLGGQASGIVAPPPPRLGIEEFLAQVSAAAAERAKNPGNAAAALVLLSARRMLADLWTSIPDDQLEPLYRGAGGQVHRILADANLPLFSATIGDPAHRAQEHARAVEQAKTLTGGISGPAQVKHFLAAWLYLGAHELQHRFDLPAVPAWLTGDYLLYMLRPPTILWEVGQTQAYADFMRRWVGYLHANVLQRPNEPLWRDAAAVFLQHNNYIPLYFVDANLKDMYVQRAQIMEMALKAMGLATDYAFGPRPTNRVRIRVGILSTHLNPQTETYTTLPIYKHLDRRRFEVRLYAVTLNGHPLERQLSAFADAVVQLPPNLAQQVARIRQDDLDILVVATNVTAVTNPVTTLALHRLARAHVISTNSTVTTGMRHSDYYVSGNLIEGPGAQEQYSETLLLIEGTGLCSDFAFDAAETPTVTASRAEAGIPPDAVLFASGANFHKITPEMEHTWARILAAVPHSYLMLYPFNRNWSPHYPVQAFLERLGQTLAERGLGIDRVAVFLPAPNRADVRLRLTLADVFLDNFPFSGFYSLLDPLFVGLPVVACRGRTLRGNQGAALLTELQIPELIAEDADAFIRLAVALGTDPALRRRLADKVRQGMAAGPRFLDSRRYSAQMQDVFLKVLKT